MEETKKTIYMQSLKSRQAVTVRHQNNREVTANVLMLLSVCALAADNPRCQQRVGGSSVAGKGGGKERQSQAGSQQRSPETRDTQRQPDMGVLMSDAKTETQSVPESSDGVGVGAGGRTRKPGGSQSGTWGQC